MPLWWPAALAALAAPVEHAAACSCIPPDVSRDLPQADAAFVGTLVSTRIEAGAAFTTFAVERVVKGELPASVTVRSSADGASCGIELTDGARTGLLLQRGGGDWVSGLCSQVAADALLAVVPAAEEGRAWLWIVAGAVVLASAAGAVWARSRR